MSNLKLKIKKGDLVKVIAGDNKGRDGRVLEVIKTDNANETKVVVEGVNIITKHTKPTAQNTKGGIVKTEAPIHISNVMLVDPKLNKPTRVGRVAENGAIQRVAKKSKEIIK